MVLEGLKRAEQLVALLHSAGFKRPDAKPIKPEHFDSEFEARQFSGPLAALLDSLERRLLTSEDVARLKQLAALGLLDGIIDETVGEREASLVEERSARIETAQRLNTVYDTVLENLKVQEQRLDMEIQDLHAQLNSFAQLSSFAELNSFALAANKQPLSSLRLRSIAAGNVEEGMQACFAEFSRLDGEITAAICEAVKDLSESLSCGLESDPSSRLESVENAALCRRFWHPRDYEYYTEKLNLAVAKLAQLQGQDGEEEEEGFTAAIGVADEHRIALIRQRYHADLLEHITELEGERLGLVRLFVWRARLYEKNTKRHLEAVEALHGSCASALAPILAFLDRTEHFEPYSLISERADELAGAEASTLSAWQEELSEAQTLADALASSLLDLAHLEVHLVSPKIRDAETELRQLSMEMSAALQEVATESARIKLAYPN